MLKWNVIVCDRSVKLMKIGVENPLLINKRGAGFEHVVFLWESGNMEFFFNSDGFFIIYLC
jgi:hypothetical protein